MQDEERYRLMCELSGAKRRAERMESKVRKIRALVEKADNEKVEELKVRAVLNYISLCLIDKCYDYTHPGLLYTCKVLYCRLYTL